MYSLFDLHFVVFCLGGDKGDYEKILEFLEKHIPVFDNYKLFRRSGKNEGNDTDRMGVR